MIKPVKLGKIKNLTRDETIGTPFEWIENSIVDVRVSTQVFRIGTFAQKESIVHQNANADPPFCCFQQMLLQCLTNCIVCPKKGLKVESPGVMVIEAMFDGDFLNITPKDFGGTDVGAKIKTEFEGLVKRL